MMHNQCVTLLSCLPDSKAHDVECIQTKKNTTNKTAPQTYLAVGTNSQSILLKHSRDISDIVFSRHKEGKILAI